VAARRWQVLTAVCTAVFLGAIDFYIVSIAVPDLLRSFSHAGIAEISWVINGYAITYTAALLPAGGLADRFGRRRIFVLGLGTFSVSALVCAVAPSAAVLIAARCVQGIGAGTITPLALTLILPQFPADRRGTAIGLWTATQSAAVAAGPSLGGVLVAAVGWRAVFILQLPIGLAALGGAVWALDRDRPADRGSAPPDLLGVLLLGAAIGLPSLAIVQSHAWGALDGGRTRRSARVSRQPRFSCGGCATSRCRSLISACSGTRSSDGRTASCCLPGWSCSLCRSPTCSS